ncbi:MAG: glycosyltransferase family 2 protein [Ruminococcus sp.]|nr:glycosyltransferase family 2 protein [Candidatus Copronaster equi]
MKVSLVVPCFNEEESVDRFYNTVVDVFRDNIEDYEIVFVDDGSRDRTLEKLRAIYNSSPCVKVVSFSRNFGKEAAIYAGLQNSNGDYTCVIDADLQQRPEVVVEMKNILDRFPDVDCVAAFQEERKEGKAITFLKDKFYDVINKITDVEFYKGASDFRLMRRQMVDAVLDMTEYHRFSKGLFSFVGFNTKYIPYEVQEREAGESKWSVVKLFKYAIEGIIGYTTTPLRISTAVGIGSILISFIYLILALIIGACVHKITAAIAIITLILLMGGLNFVFIGIIGEYLARTYMQGKNRPVYIAKEILRRDD